MTLQAQTAIWSSVTISMPAAIEPMRESKS